MIQNDSTKKDITARISSIRWRRRFNFLRRFLILLAVAVFITLLLSGFFTPFFNFLEDSITHIRLAVDQGDGFPEELSLPGIISAVPVGGGAMVVGEKEMAFISPTGKQIRRIGNSYANPLFEASDDRVLIYTRGASDYRIEGYYQTFITAELDEDIFLADIADSGSYTIAMSDPKFRSSVNIYNPSGTELFNYKLAEEMPVVIEFSSNSNYLAVATVYSVNGVLLTNIYGFSISSREIIGVVEGIPGVCLSLSFQSNDRIMAVFDDKAAVFSLGDGETVAEHSFNNKQLLKFSVSGNGDKLALLLGEEQLPESITLMIFDSSLNLNGETIIAFSVDNLQYSEYNLMVSSGSTLYRYNDNAQPIEEEQFSYSEKIISILENGFCVGGEFIYEIY